MTESSRAALPLTVAAVLICFAGNSVLTRAGVGGGHMAAMPFALVRLASGAVALAFIVALRHGRVGLGGPHRVGGVLSLALYMVGFSVAYLSLDSGAGALILFGGVQVVMFAGALAGREVIPPLRWAGASLALCGLIWLLWPGTAAAPSLVHGGAMALAALGWGVYSMIGRRMGDPLGATAANFILATPLVAMALLILPTTPGGPPATATGVALAVASGVLASGMGYAMWYGILPRLASATAALLQLAVPVLAALGGVVFLAEPLTARLMMAAALVLGGVAMGVAGTARANPGV